MLPTYTIAAYEMYSHNWHTVMYVLVTNKLLCHLNLQMLLPVHVIPINKTI